MLAGSAWLSLLRPAPTERPMWKLSRTRLAPARGKVACCAPAAVRRVESSPWPPPLPRRRSG